MRLPVKSFSKGSPKDVQGRRETGACHRSRGNSCLEDFVEWIDEGIEFLKH